MSTGAKHLKLIINLNNMDVASFLDLALAYGWLPILEPHLRCCRSPGYTSHFAILIYLKVMSASLDAINAC